MDYYKSKEYTYNNLNNILTYNEKFKQDVNASVSSVHIPVEIYDKGGRHSTVMLYHVNWVYTSRVSFDMMSKHPEKDTV